MATFTITAANTNIDTLSGKTGGDVYNVNGGVLVIDQDSRYGANQSASASLAGMTISATLGGTIDIDARAVRWIPYNSGTGNVPAGGTTISQGGTTGKLICVASAINVAPTAAAAAMPASGWIKVKQVSGAYAAGALTGIGASATGADVVAPISLVGDEGATCTVPRLGLFRMRGAWFDVGTASGSSATTYQLPTQGEVFYLAGVQVETAPGSGIFEWYPCAGSLVAAASFGTDAVRGKVCWISTAGVLRLGSDGTNTTGYVPAAGCKIRMPNILTANCTTAARTANALPSTTLATRYDFSTSGAGVLEIDKANLAWFPSFTQAYSVTLTDVSIHEQLNVSECATFSTWTRLCVGQSAAQSQAPLVGALNFAGGSVSDSVFTRATMAAGNACVAMSDSSDWTFTRCRGQSLALRSAATPYAFSFIRVARSNVIDCTAVGCAVQLSTSSDCLVQNLKFADRSGGTTLTTLGISAVDIQATSANITVDGINFGGLTNLQPYTALVTTGTGNSKNLTIRNIGTRAAPLSLGSVNATGLAISGQASAATNGLRIQRVYVSNTRTNLWSMDNSHTNVTIDNCAGDFADVPAMAQLNAIARGIGGTVSLTGDTAVYGTHWGDSFTSTTAGRLLLRLNEPTAQTAAQVALTNGAQFTSAGSLYMPTIGMTATFTMPYFMLGHTSFQNAAAVMAGGTITNYSLEFQADTGGGFGAWTALTGANLSALGAFPATGIKLKLRITTTTANTTAISSLYLLTNTTTTAMDAGLYPLDTNTVTFTGLPTGCDVVVLTAGTSTILDQVDSNPASSYAFTYSGAQTVDVGFIKPGYVPLYLRNLALTTSNASIPVSLTVDRNYS